MIIRKGKTILLGVVAAGLSTWQPANAGFSQGDTVTLGGQPAFEMAAADGFSGEHRAWLAQDALDNALVAASDRSPAAVAVARENGAVVLTLSGCRFATVDSNSASVAGLTPDALADKWAGSVRNFLSDQSRTDAYVATLKNENRIHANVALLERTFYAPVGFTFPISLTSALTTETCAAGDVVEGTIDKDVMMGHYAIPAGSVVTGEVCLAKAGEPGNFNIRFQSLRTPDGKTVSIDAVCLAESLILSQGPHRVCTYAIPSGMANGIPEVAGRVPAGIGIGTLDTGGSNILVFNKTMGILTAGRPMFVEFEKASKVVVIMRQTM